MPRLACASGTRSAAASAPVKAAAPAAPASARAHRGPVVFALSTVDCRVSRSPCHHPHDTATTAPKAMASAAWNTSPSSSASAAGSAARATPATSVAAPPRSRRARAMAPSAHQGNQEAAGSSSPAVQADVVYPDSAQPSATITPTARPRPNRRANSSIPTAPHTRCANPAADTSRAIDGNQINQVGG